MPYIRPPFDEQQLITSYLDDKCAKIDEAITKHRTLIEKLKEYRKAVITKTVTKGLDPNAEMNDSGITWIGEMCRGWSITPIKHLFKVNSGATPKSGNSLFWGDEIAWVTPADFKTATKYITNGAKSITKAGYDSCNTELVPAGSIVVSKRAPIGELSIATSDLCTNQGCLTCVPKKEVDSNYYFYALIAAVEHMNALGNGTTFQELSTTKFKNMKIVEPPYEEQKRISKYLDEKWTKIDEAIARHEGLITKLEEYKKSIIYNAVTGKIDCRKDSL